MPELMRFGQVDPVTDEQENYSPYQYGWNNPVLRSDPNGDCPICFIFLAGLLLASEPALAPSGGKNAKQEMAAYRQTYNDMGSDVISSVMPVGKSKPVGQALYATAKKEAKEEIKEQSQKISEKVIASAKEKANPFLKKSKEDLVSDKKKFTDMIKEHKEKVEELKKDPIGKSSKEWIDVATKDNPSREVLLKRAEGRIPALEKQIIKQEGELKKINEALKLKEQ